MKISNDKVYNLEEALVASGYAMLPEYDPKLVDIDVEKLAMFLDDLETDEFTDPKDSKHFRRGMNLGNCEKSSGHPNYLSGVLVAFDCTATNKFWIEFQRYHFAQIVTGTSTMHRMAKFDLENAFNIYTDTIIIDRLKELQRKYHEKPTAERYLRLLYSTPSGLEMTNHITTNYLQLSNMFNQRCKHRLPEWIEFCEWCLTLPNFTELTGCTAEQIREMK